MLETLDLPITIADQSALPVQLRLQIAVLVAALIMHTQLLVDFAPKRLNEANVAVDALGVLLLHQALLLV